MTTILKNTTIAGTGHLTIPVGTTNQRPAVNTSIIQWTNTGSQAYSVLSGATPTLTNTSWTAPAGVNTVEVLVVAGGGSGGNAIANSGTPGGGGGAGGVVHNANYSVTPGQTYAIAVGAGGAAVANMGASPVGGKGRQGSNSLFGVGTNLVTNGDFSSATGWSVGSNIAISGGTATYSSPTHGTNLQQTATAFTAGVTYTISFTVTSYTSGAITIYANYSSGTAVLVATSIGFTTGDFSYQFTPTTNGTGFSLQADAATVGACSLTIDNVAIYASTNNIVAIGGGGGGGGYSPNGLPGGSGGGSCGGVGGAAIPGQGYPGGNYRIRNSGGGGAGGPGNADLNDTSGQILGGGGPGLNFSTSGFPTYYAGGGGAGASTSNTTLPGIGGIGGGGNGGNYNDATGGIAGTASTGGGGGGSSARGGSANPSGAGGSGIVILRYASLSDGTDTRALVRYNTDLRDVELYENVATGWTAQDTARNLGGHNLVTYSEQFDNAAWTKTNISIVANSVQAPDGTLTADTWVENTASGAQHAVNLASTVSASPNTYYTFSIYAKAAGRTRLYINFSDINFAGNAWNMDLSAVTISLSSSGWTTGTSSATITDVGNGWRRITITGQTTGSVTQVGPYIYLADNSGTVNYTGDGTSGAYFWGAQVERSNTAGPYVRTTTALSPTPTVLNGYRTHTYTTTGTSGFTPTVSGNVEVLVVAGGGAGGNNHAGGGGGGGVIYNPNYPVIAGRSYTVTVGAGGVAAGTGANNNTNGGNSAFGTLVAIGGGAGGNRNDTASTSPGQSGGSGGGGGGAQAVYPGNYAAGAGTNGQGNPGGVSIDIIGAGGGGAGAPGESTATVSGYGGTGGAGLQFSISGTPTWYAGGGSGSNGNNTTPANPLGGGGAGGSTVGSNGTAGTANTGGGGGGGGAGNTTGSNGGSGIVIVRYRYD
jgi:hypothetical protein